VKRNTILLFNTIKCCVSSAVVVNKEVGMVGFWFSFPQKNIFSKFPKFLIKTLSKIGVLHYFLPFPTFNYLVTFTDIVLFQSPPPRFGEKVRDRYPIWGL